METTPTPPVETAPPVKNPSQPPPSTDPGGEDKMVAILSYCTLIGFIVAIILHHQKKTKLGAYHLRQVLGFAVTGIVAWICLAILCFLMVLILAFMKSFVLLLVPLIYFAFGISILVLWIMGFIAAIKGEMKPMPVVGPLYQKWFGTLFD